MRRFTADFETNNYGDKANVWAWGVCEIGAPDNFTYGNNIDDFILFCYKQKTNIQLYFHNLHFDGEFIFYYLLTHGYTYIKDKKDRQDKTFTTLISSLGQFYSIEIFFEVKEKKIKKVTIYDSLKIINMSVEKIAKDFKLPILKGEIDYSLIREEGHELTDEEVAYLRNDVEIMSRALDIMFNEGLTKMTIGSDALSFYKDINQNFINYFPILDYNVDASIRQSYKGGFTYLNPIYKDKVVDNGIVLDVNSLYPSVLYNERIPIGLPVYFAGKYQDNKLYDLYIQRISCIFKIKEGKIPTIQIKGQERYFVPNEYLESSEGEIVVLTLTNIDLKLFLEHYDVFELEYIDGFMFKSQSGLFKTYIDYWSNKKIEAKKEGNDAIYKISKLMLNSLYGKFGLNPNVRSKYPCLEDDKIRYIMHDPETRDPIYIPVATFVTSYARNKTIRTSQKIRDYTIQNYGKDFYIYSDTDSIHMLKMEEEELKRFVDIDDYILGYWKLESEFVQGKFLRQKCYIEKSIDGKINVTVAGLPKFLGDKITFENFKKGFTAKGKLTFGHVNGGVILKETDFTIK